MPQVGGVNLDGIPFATRSLTTVCAAMGMALINPTRATAVTIFVLTIHDSLFGVEDPAFFGAHQTESPGLQVPCHFVCRSASSAGQRCYVLILRFNPGAIGSVQHLHADRRSIRHGELHFTPRQSLTLRRISSDSGRGAVTKERLGHTVRLCR